MDQTDGNGYNSGYWLSPYYVPNTIILIVATL